MNVKQKYWSLPFVMAVFLLTACININRQYNVTQTSQEAEAKPNSQTANIRPSPTPVAAAPGIIYQTEDGLWQVINHNESIRLTTAPAINPPTTQQLRDFNIDEDRLQYAALSPNGNWLAITRREEDGQTTVWVIGYQNDEQIFLGKGTNAVWSPDGRLLIYNTNGRPQLVLTDQNFYQIHLNLPPGSQVIAWPTLTE